MPTAVSPAEAMAYLATRGVVEALEKKPGLTVVEVIRAAEAGQVRGMYILGENPAMSDPDAGHARAAMAKLEHLVVQDIFLTETCYLADVVLPATAFPEKTGTFTNTDRMVQLGRQALDAPGEARPDLWIIEQMARRLGLAWDYADVSEVFDEMRRSMHSIAGITWDFRGVTLLALAVYGVGIAGVLWSRSARHAPVARPRAAQSA
jgi:formate dehydrogenase major subunit